MSGNFTYCEDDPAIVSWLEPLVLAIYITSCVCMVLPLFYTWYLAWLTEKHMCDLQEVIVVDEDEDSEYDCDSIDRKLQHRQSMADMYEVMPEEIAIKSNKIERRGSTWDTIDEDDEESSSIDEKDETEEEKSEVESSVRSSVSMPSVSTRDERGNSMEMTKEDENQQNTDVDVGDSRRESEETLTKGLCK